MKLITKHTIGAALCSLGLYSSSSAASFVLTGGDITNGANWQNIADNSTGVLPTTGDDATINVNGTAAGQLAGDLAGATVTQIGGVLTATGFNWNSSAGTNTVYNLQGGEINATGNFNGQSVTFNLSGGVFTFDQELILNGVGGSYNISGDVVLNAANDFDIFLNNDTSVFDIATDWTGSFTSTVNTTVADWTFELVDGVGDDDNGTANSQRFITVGGTQVTSANFEDFFVVSNDGGVSSLSLVPEPSSTALLGLGGLALIMRRRK